MTYDTYLVYASPFPVHAIPVFILSHITHSQINHIRINIDIWYARQVGNLANDGVKLASGNRKCSAEPQDGLEVEAKGGTLRSVTPFHCIHIF